MRTITQASAFMLLGLTLAGCSGGDEPASNRPTTTRTEPPISMTTALSSDKEAAKACAALLGDGKQLATWADLPGASFHVTSSRGVKGEDSERTINCAVRDSTGSGDEIHLKLFGPGSSTYYTHELDEGSSHEGAEVVTATNSAQGTAVLTQDVTTLNKGPATQQLQRMAERLTR